jgi:hypothetical protein
MSCVIPCAGSQMVPMKVPTHSFRNWKAHSPTLKNHLISHGAFQLTHSVLLMNAKLYFVLTADVICVQMPKGRCKNCEAHSPTIKRQGHTRLFKVWPSTKAVMQNLKTGKVTRSVLHQQHQQHQVGCVCVCVCVCACACVCVCVCV